VRGALDRPGLRPPGMCGRRGVRAGNGCAAHAGQARAPLQARHIPSRQARGRRAWKRSPSSPASLGPGVSRRQSGSAARARAPPPGSAPAAAAGAAASAASGACTSRNASSDCSADRARTSRLRKRRCSPAPRRAARGRAAAQGHANAQPVRCVLRLLEHPACPGEGKKMGWQAGTARGSTKLLALNSSEAAVLQCRRALCEAAAHSCVWCLGRRDPAARPPGRGARMAYSPKISRDSPVAVV